MIQSVFHFAFIPSQCFSPIHCGVKSIQILTPLHFSTPKLQLAELRDFDQGVRDVAGGDLF